MGTNVAFLNIRDDPTPNTTWGLLEHYVFGLDTDQSQSQLNRTITSTITITSPQHLDSLILATWNKLGPVPGQPYDPLSDNCKDLANATRSSARSAIAHSAHGYDGFSPEWQNPLIFLRPSEQATTHDKLTAKCTVHNNTRTEYTTIVTLKRENRTVRRWRIHFLLVSAESMVFDH